MANFNKIATVSMLSLSLFGPSARAQADDVAFDFRATQPRTTAGKTTKTETTGHTVMSKGRMRLEMTGSSPLAGMPGVAPGSTFTMILPDTGRTFLILQP